jgi:phospholipid/cholesterol/gamma-HCH transport system ATP-binding protein
MTANDLITVTDLSVGFGSLVLLRRGSFTVRRGEIFFIIGPSGCGKTTLLRCMLGLETSLGGSIRFGRDEMVGAAPDERTRILRRCGVVFQSGGLLSSMTLAENVALPFGGLGVAPAEVRAVSRLKLSLVGLSGFEELYPLQLSAGMQRRACLARAMVLDPELLFLDEPSAGLDPLNARRLDDLVLEMRDSLGATVVVVSHDLASIFAVADYAIYMDPQTRTLSTRGRPKELLEHAEDPQLRAFLTRGRLPTEYHV